MKKTAIILMILITVISGKLFSQDQTEQSKTPIKPALLVIDTQNAYLPMVPEREMGVATYYINSLIELFRSNGYPVVRIYHHDAEAGPHPGSEQFEFPASILVKDDDARVIKTYGNGFTKTDLDKVLKEKGCNTLFLCGLSAVGCVLATRVGAQDHDYKAFMVKDAIMSHNSDYTNQVEDMFGAVGYDVVRLIVELATRLTKNINDENDNEKYYLTTKTKTKNPLMKRHCKLEGIYFSLPAFALSGN